MDKVKNVVIIAGPNGSGKTTFARAFLAPLKDSIRFINADFIAAGLSQFAPELMAVRAGKIMLLRPLCLVKATLNIFNGGVRLGIR